tara:strand:- start:2313 stop:2762 length:450 start_codon:yes stop_codon:yes gene_type:complete
MSMFQVSYINKTIIDEIIYILENNNIVAVNEESCTIKGFQTDNIINLFKTDLLKKILPMEDFYKKIFHLHYIYYYLNGYQMEHNHIKTEKYSFILYLNNADGNTIFKEPISESISPELGKLIFFSSDIMHRSEISTNGKKVLVGAVDKV